MFRYLRDDTKTIAFPDKAKARRNRAWCFCDVLNGPANEEGWTLLWSEVEMRARLERVDLSHCALLFAQLPLINLFCICLTDMSDEAVKRWLKLMNKPTLKVVPTLSTTASSPAAPVGGSCSTGRDNFVDLTSEDDKGNQGAELPVAEAITPVPAPIEEQGMTTSLPPPVEERASADDKGKGVKRAEPSQIIRADLKRPKLSALGSALYVEQTVDRFVASGPSNEDLRAFLAAHKSMHPMAKSFLEALEPEDLAREAMRAMVLVSTSRGTLSAYCFMASRSDLPFPGA